MSSLPIVTPRTREHIAREFDDRGPAVCTAEAIADLKRTNPELFDIAAKCASSLENYTKIMTGFGMFYRLILAPATPNPGLPVLSLLPRVSPDTRDEIVRQIDDLGSEDFTMTVIAHMERNNPELLQMAHRFASNRADYLLVMQGFALFYKALVDQTAADRVRLQ